MNIHQPANAAMENPFHVALCSCSHTNTPVNLPVDIEQLTGAALAISVSMELTSAAADTWQSAHKKSIREMSFW